MISIIIPVFNSENTIEILVNSIKKTLEEHGIDVTSVVDHKFLRSIYFTDPNGIALEASCWVKDPTCGEPDYDDPELFEDPDPVPSAPHWVKIT